MSPTAAEVAVVQEEDPLFEVSQIEMVLPWLDARIFSAMGLNVRDSILLGADNKMLDDSDEDSRFERESDQILI